MSTEKLSVVELRAAAEKLFAHLDNSGNSDLEIDVDYYWHVPAEDRYDMNHEPAELTVGQLSSDIDELLRLSWSFAIRAKRRSFDSQRTTAAQ